MPILFILILKSEGIHKKRFLLKNLYLFIILCVGAITFFILKKGVSITQMLVDLQQLNIIGNPAHYVNTWSFFFQLGPIIMAFFILSTIFFVLKKQLNYLLLIAWILVPGIFFFNTTLRYMLPVFPAIIIGAAILISHLKKQLCIFTTALIFISSIGVVFVGYAPMMYNEFADVNILLAANYIDDLPEIETAGIYLLPVEILNTTSPKLEIGGYLFDYYSQKSMAFDTPPRINEFYRQMYKSRFEVFNFYKDKCFYDFSCDTMIILSDTTDYFDLIFTPFAEDLHDQLAKDYTLSKRFMQGMQSVERNYVVDIYTKT